MYHPGVGTLILRPSQLRPAEASGQGVVLVCCMLDHPAGTSGIENTLQHFGAPQQTVPISALPDCWRALLRRRGLWRSRLLRPSGSTLFPKAHVVNRLQLSTSTHALLIHEAAARPILVGWFPALPAAHHLYPHRRPEWGYTTK